MKLFKQLILIFLIYSLTGCVQDAHPKIITVKVDMTGVETASKVGIRGEDPLSWDETTYLNDADGDGIYEDTFEVYTANQNVEFKFVTSDNQFELQDQNNRSLTFEYKPETIIYKAVFDNLDKTTITRE
jgi:hypothetical protein